MSAEEKRETVELPLRVELGDNPHDCHVWIGDTEISDRVTRVRIDAVAGHVPTRVEITMFVIKGDKISYKTVTSTLEVKNVRHAHDA